MMHDNRYKTWYEIIFKHRSILLDAGLIFISVVVLGLLSHIKIPLWPVPITMQTFGVFLIAFFFGSFRAAISLLAYIAAGLLGFAVFAGSNAGISVFYTIKDGVVALGPSAGYIIGFVFAAFLVGWMIEKGYGRNWKSILYVLLLGELVIYAFGLPWLWLALPGSTLWQILMWGLIPFIIGDTLKMLGAAALFPYMWKGASRISQ